MDLTSVPVSSMPASNFSSMKYSWNAFWFRAAIFTPSAMEHTSLRQSYAVYYISHVKRFPVLRVPDDTVQQILLKCAALLRA